MIYVMSDIHGNLANFNSILEQIDLQADDTLYVLGDVIDRHPYGIEILQKIIRMPNAQMLLGNHEYMMFNYLNYPYKRSGNKSEESQSYLLLNWYYNGGKVTHNAFNKLSEDEQKEIVEYLNKCPLNFAVEVNDKKFKLMHAMPEDVYKAAKQYTPLSATSFCVWEREMQPLLAKLPAYISVFGHTPTAYFQNHNPLEIYHNENMIGIDCGSGFPKPKNKNDAMGRLACLRLDDMKEFYSE